MTDRPLLMIPGPVEIADEVLAAASIRPPSHLAPDFKAAFSRALKAMRQVWRADDTHQPFVVAGSGTLAMEAAATNLVDPGEPVLVVNAGLFGDRMAEMLRRRGAIVHQVGSRPGGTPPLEEVDAALADHRPKVLFVTHVDTSTGVRSDAQGILALARRHGALSVVDGVCATAGEPLEQGAWGADVVLTASQKAIGLPPGLALWVASPAALAARRALTVPPPMVLDWLQWLPILEAYEAEANSYFATPSTTLIPALDVGLASLLADGMPAVWARHQRAADACRAAWDAMGLVLVADSPANTLSALSWPDRVDAGALPRIAARGAIVAGGLHPALRSTTFRVGHMGDVTRHPGRVRRAVAAVGLGLRDAGGDVDVDAGLRAFDAHV